MSSLVDSSSQVSISLLTCRVPNLNFEFEVIDLKGFDFEIDSYCGNVTHVVVCTDKSEEKIGLAYGSVADDRHFG